MPSKYNEKMLRVDRMNRMEKTRLDFMIRRYDKEKISLVHEIDREKRAVVKDFVHVKRTSGFSEEGIAPTNEKDEDFKNDPILRLGTKISEKRLNSAKSLRSSSSRSRTYFNSNGNFRSPRNPSNSSESDDDVFITEETTTIPLPDLYNTADIERYERDLIESYKNVFKNTDISVKKSDRKNLTRFLRARSKSELNNKKILRPQTAKYTKSYDRQFSLPVRPATANGSSSTEDRNGFYENEYQFDVGTNSENYLSRQSTSGNNISNGNSLHTVAEDPENVNLVSPSVKQLIEQILEEEVDGSTQKSEYAPNYKIKPEHGILKTRKVSASTTQTSDIDMDSNAKLTKHGQKNRRVSINSTSVASEFDRSVVSNMWGSIGDLSLDSNGQRKPSNWRKYVAAEKAPIPQSKRLVNLTTVVKAALAFSKTARRRALDKLVEEQSSDTRQLIQEERLRRLQSRNSILMSLSTQWSVDKDSEKPFTLMEEENL